MTFNSGKFEVIRYWPKGSPPDVQYLSPDLSPIEEKKELKVLGVQLSNDLKFSSHIDNTLAAANRLIGMACRSFRRRSRNVMVTTWKCIIQPKLDYCSQLWSPSDQRSIQKLESVMRTYTSKISGLETYDFWDRLKELRLLSQERRRERYIIIFLWKMSQGLIEGYSIPFVINPRRGRLAVIPPINNQSPASVRNAREASLAVKGCKLFNLLPPHIRNINSNTPDTFKACLDNYLSLVPDQPTVPGRVRSAVTNSLIDQIPLMGM